MSSFIEITGINEVAEPQVMPEGTYDLVIESFDEHIKEGSNRTIYKARVGFEGNDEAQSFLHFISLPSESDEENTKKLLLRQLKRFLVTFNIPFEGGFNPDDCVGSSGKCPVKCEIPEGYDDEVNSLKLPKISQ